MNLSPSMPKGIYLLSQCGDAEARDAGVGSLVAIDTAEASNNAALAFFRARGWLSYSGRADDLLMKRIVAVSGDQVSEQDGRLCVNGERLGEEASARTREVDGVALPNIDLPQRVRENEVWVSSAHTKGIDSRYFGAVARSSIACRVEPIWTL